ncbi:hypothetical protein QRD43_20410 [Pelomonas sp. APW6]|uniref:Peptidase M41 domain-containing protein n=1 Tax=Roseateles subflavus TaxID=3053353 RepID=A0ABT7LN24_9BURK|nr:hypothetical protein [Pelomonas sp. APW6]MDL5034276.1 hypothetical protein [Pelomonas sp. APW6]
MMKYLKHIARWLSHNTWSIWAAVAIAVVPLGLSIEPNTDASPLLRKILTYTLNLGVMVLVLRLSVRSIIGDGQALFRACARGFAALAMTCMALVQFGDAVIAWARAEPLAATAAGVALVLVRFVVHAAQTSRQGDLLLHPRLAGGADGLASLMQRQRPSALDDRSTAVHEAGHAMVHAALEELPSEFEMVMGQDLDTGSLGFVTGLVDGENLLVRRSFAEWRMLMLLAGMAAEKALLGCETLGGVSDYRMWMATASVYLANGVKGVFFSEPRGADQLMMNKVALGQLQRDQEALLAEFFEMNIDVLTELANQLMAHRRLDAGALEPFLARVKFPDAFPRLKLSPPAQSAA